jgi:hypothetical protein
MAIGRPVEEVCASGAGQDNASGSGVGTGVGAVELLAHAVVASRSDKAMQKPAREKEMERPKISYRPTIAATSIAGQEVA